MSTNSQASPNNIIYIDWQPGTVVEPPVYLDANVLVGAVISGHRLYRSCITLLGELLLNRSRILVSALSIQECLWAIVRLSYYDLNNRQPPNAHFTQVIYKRWCDRIFAAYGSRINAVNSMLNDWVSAGVQIEVVPGMDTFWSVSRMTPAYMRQLRLAPADAFHLALAQAHARTFITGDADFQSVTKQSYPGELIILHIVPS